MIYSNFKQENPGNTVKDDNRGGIIINLVKGIILGCIIIIGGFILLIAIKGHLSMRNRARAHQVKSNMHVVGQWAITYAGKHNGYYPAMLDTEICKANKLQKPIDTWTPLLVLFADTTGMEKNLKRGQIAYIPLEVSSNGAEKYIIVGKWKNGETLLRLPDIR